MKLTKIRCWNVKGGAYDIDALAKSEPDLDLIKKSILKNGYRAYCLNRREEIETQEWYREHLLGRIALFYIEGSGVYKLANIDLTENEFYFEKDNLPAGFKPWIFYSWQSDYNPSRSHIGDALSTAVAFINETPGLKASIAVVESTRPEDGSGDIVDAIKRNIDLSLVAVFDITNVAVTQATEEGQVSKAYPNANVVFELSYALQRKRKDQVILVRRKRTDLPSDVVPFDFQQLRHLQYTSESDAAKNLKKVLTGALEHLGFIRQ